MSGDIEFDLLRQARDGDMFAYEDLQLRLEPPIRRFIRRLIGMHHAEDDIMQDVFLSFYLNLSNIDPVENLRPYLYRIARNRCYDELRRQGRRETVSLDDEPTQVWVSFTEANRQPQPEDLTHWLLLHLEVQNAIQKLPDTQRDALILYTEENMTYAEIAEVMDTSIGTVKSRIYYAKKGLRQYLSPDTLAVLEQEFGQDERPKRKQQTSKETTHERLPEPTG